MCECVCVCTYTCMCKQIHNNNYYTHVSKCIPQFFDFIVLATNKYFSYCFNIIPNKQLPYSRMNITLNNKEELRIEEVVELTIQLFHKPIILFNISMNSQWGRCVEDSSVNRIDYSHPEYQAALLLQTAPQ